MGVDPKRVRAPPNNRPLLKQSFRNHASAWQLSVNEDEPDIQVASKLLLDARRVRTTLPQSNMKPLHALYSRRCY